METDKLLKLVERTIPAALRERVPGPGRAERLGTLGFGFVVLNRTRALSFERPRTYVRLGERVAAVLGGIRLALEDRVALFGKRGPNTLVKITDLMPRRAQEAPVDRLPRGTESVELFLLPLGPGLGLSSTIFDALECLGTCHTRRIS